MVNKLENGELISYATVRGEYERDLVERMLFKCARKLNAQYRHASFWENPSEFMSIGTVETKEIEQMLQVQSAESSEAEEDVR